MEYCVEKNSTDGIDRNLMCVVNHGLPARQVTTEVPVCGRRQLSVLRPRWRMNRPRLLDLVDEAFLRRMGYRLAFTTPSSETYALILQQYFSLRNLRYDPQYLFLLLSRYEKEERVMKACEPRDLVERCLDICKFENLPREITPDILNRAWDNYFGVSQ